MTTSEKADPSDIVVSLITPIEGHSGMVTEARLRRPRHADLMALGDPYVVVRLADGKQHVVTEPKTLAEYMARCLVSPDQLILERAELHDSLRIRQAFLNFFESAMVRSVG